MLNSDFPIEKIDDDKLGRGNFAEDLANVLLKNSFKSSFVIGLYGPWGSGKTSLLNMIFETIKNSGEEAVVFKFNPWLCSDARQLTSQFFKQLSSEIKLKRNIKDETWEAIDKYAGFFDIAKLIPVFGEFIASFGNALGNEAQKYLGQQSENLQQLKDDIICKLKNENMRIIVSIDDIDRLSENEIITVFQLVKSLADFPNTIYLLAFDYDVVVQALSKVQNGDGKEYLEKIIQVPFEIPMPNGNSINDYLFSKLNNILEDVSEDEWDAQKYAVIYQYGIRYYIKSMRDVNRYVNVFSLKYNSLKGETNPADLLGLTCLQVFEPNIYAKLPMYKKELCGGYNSYSFDLRNAEEKKMKKIIEALISEDRKIQNRDASRNILSILFPKVSAVSEPSYGIGIVYSHRENFVNNNIASSKCFDRYFSLTLEDDAVETEVIRQLIYKSDISEFEQTIIDLYQKGKLIWVLDEIDAYVRNYSSKKVSEDRAIVIVTGLARVWHLFEVEDNNFFSTPFEWRLILCVNPLLEAINVTERYMFVKKLFEDNQIQPSTIAIILNNFEHEWGRFGDREENEEKIIGSLDELIGLEELFKKRAVNAIESGDAVKYYNGLEFMWLLNKIDSKLTAEKKCKIIKDDTSLVAVIGHCISHGKVSTWKTSKTWRLDKEYLSGFIDIDNAYERCNNIFKSDDFWGLTEEEQLNILAFLYIIDNEDKKGNTEMEDKYFIQEDVLRHEMQIRKKNTDNEQ